MTAIPCGQAHTGQAYGSFTYPDMPVDVSATVEPGTPAMPAAETIDAKAEPEPRF